MTMRARGNGWISISVRGNLPRRDTSALPLAATAIGLEPQGFADSAPFKASEQRLRRYLRSHVDQPLWNRLRRRDDPSLFNRALLLWTSANLPGLLSSDERRSIVSELCAAQRADGSWQLWSLGRFGGLGAACQAIRSATATRQGWSRMRSRKPAQRLTNHTSRWHSHDLRITRRSVRACGMLRR